MVVSRLLRCIRWYLDGHTERISSYDLLRLSDACGSFPQSEPDLDKVYDDLFRQWQKRLLAEETSHVRPAVADAMANVPQPTLEKLAKLFQAELKRRAKTDPL